MLGKGAIFIEKYTIIIKNHIQTSVLHCIALNRLYAFFSLEIKPTILALIAPCSSLTGTHTCLVYINNMNTGTSQTRSHEKTWANFYV